MQLNDNQRRRIELALEDLSDASLLQLLETPVEYHYFVWHYNWDDGIDRIRELVTSTGCDRGTALLAYWLSGPFICEMPTRNSCSDYELPIFDCIANLEERLLADDFRNRNIAVDPKKLLSDNDDWTQIEFDRDAPHSLTKATPGIVLPEDDLTYELTAADIARREEMDVKADLENLKIMAERDPAYRDNLIAYQRWLAERDE